MRLLLALALMVVTLPAHAQAPKTLTYFDAPAFDQQLADSLASKTQVSVEFPPGVPTANLPPRVSMWIAAVQNKGGKVNLAGAADGKEEQFVQALRPVLLSVISGFVGSAFPSVTDIGAFVKEYRLFRHLDAYDATLVYDRASGNLLRMGLLPRG
jgi:hypothetical protein